LPTQHGGRYTLPRLNYRTLTGDTIIFGAIAGMLGNIPKTIIAWIFHYFGWLRYTFIHIAAGYFVDAKFLDNPVSLATGVLADFISAGLFGAGMYYVLKKTGFTFAVSKGFAFGSFLYLLFYGALMALDITRASLLTPLPNLLLFFPHMLYGATTCWILQKYHRPDRT